MSGDRVRERLPEPGSGGRTPGATPAGRGTLLVGGLLLVACVALAAGVVGLVWAARSGLLPEPSASTEPAGGDAYAEVRDAPPLELTDQAGRPFSLASLRGTPVLVFFGYTHCPDVCPTTVGVVRGALAAVDLGPRAVFVSIDPERDTPEAMAQYVRYLPESFVGLTGTPPEVRRAADAWGVSYARVDTGSAGGYAMAHTADLYLVDAAGRLRMHFPFGTPEAPIAEALRGLLAEARTADGSMAPPATPPPTAPPVTQPPVPAATSRPAPGGRVVQPLVLSSSVWAGGGSPVILDLFDEAGIRLDGNHAVTVQVADAAGAAVGSPVVARAVQPPGVADASFVATIDVPAAGRWRLDVAVDAGPSTRRGTTDLYVLDPGLTVPLGAPAPDVHTPTLADVGGLVAAVTTAPSPELRLSQRSTSDARAAGIPYVLVIDSYRFQVSDFCGRAIVIAAFLLERWAEVAFIHLEPFEYTLVASTPVLQGEITSPTLTRVSAAWGVGEAPWTALDMPWVFIVDRDGIVRAKLTGVMGSRDIDVLLAMLGDEAGD